MKNPRHEKFLGEYLDKNSPAFGNAAKSYQSAYGIEDPKVAAAAASRLLKSKEIREELERIYEQTGINLERQIELLKQISRGESTRKTISKRLCNITNENGEIEQKMVIDTEVIREPGFADQIRASNLLCKLANGFEMTMAFGHVMDRSLQELTDRHIRDFKKPPEEREYKEEGH